MGAETVKSNLTMGAETGRLFQFRDRSFTWGAETVPIEFQHFRYDDHGNISLYFGSERQVGLDNTVLVWGCVSSSHQKALLLRVSEKFNSSTYKEILQKQILPLSDHQSKPIGLVHDWFPVHRSKAVMEFAKDNRERMTFLDWPKYFGDVMPVENVWFKMMKNFTKGNVKVVNQDNLWEQIVLGWNNICTDEFVTELIKTIPSKFEKVIQSSGSYVD